MKKKHFACLLFLIMFSLAIILPTGFCQTAYWHQVQDLNEWNVGRPGELIRFGVNVTDSLVDVHNVTLYYSINSTEQTQYQKVLMKLEEGTIRHGFWGYTLGGQPNGTDIYYAYKVYFSDGNYIGPEPSLSNPYCWKIYRPERTLELFHFKLRNVDPISLTVDIACGFKIIGPSDKNETQVWVLNKVDDHYYSAMEIVNVSQVGKHQRYWFMDVVTIEDLKLTGSGADFPFDTYFLHLEFELSYDDVKCSVDDDRVYYDYTDYIWNMEVIEPPKVVENVPLVGEHIEVILNFQRHYENFLTSIIPLMMSFSLIGASLLIESNKHLQYRLTLYLGLFVFSLNYSGYIVPTAVIGSNFVESGFLFSSFITGIFAICSLLGYYLTNPKNFKNKIIERDTYFDLFGLGIALTFFIFIDLVPLGILSRPLFSLLPNIFYQFLFILSLSYGVLIKIGIKYWKKRESKRVLNEIDY